MRITARRPADVAREVEALARQGHRAFELVSVDRGGMLDLERLGAARYSAGLQCCVALEVEVAVPVAAVR